MSGSHPRPGPGWELRATEPVWLQVRETTANGGAGALLCGVAAEPGRRRLLAREFIPAVPGVDHVDGTVGHAALTPAFVRRATRKAAALGLAYVAVHGHGRAPVAEFSGVDLCSHERGYPALLDLLDGRPAGALVVSGDGHGVAAGDLFLPDGERATIARIVVVGANITVLTDRPPAPAPAALPRHDRQARLVGAAGQNALARATVGVVGCGGGGIIVVEHLTRLGVGTVVTVDPDVVEPTNLSRLPGARRSDARPWADDPRLPASLRRLGVRLRTPKVQLANRIVRAAAGGTRHVGLRADATDAHAAALVASCDYLVLAADSDRARHLINAVVHQYLVPAVQIGVKAQTSEDGELQDLFVVARPVLPDAGCLWCQGLINPSGLARESLPAAQRAAADYGTGQPAPSVVTLNGIAASLATTFVMLSLAGLHDPGVRPAMLLHPRAPKFRAVDPRRDPDCPECGGTDASRLARGDAVPLPVSLRATER